MRLVSRSSIQGRRWLLTLLVGVVFLPVKVFGQG